jgi:hypothetical protein
MMEDPIGFTIPQEWLVPKTGTSFLNSTADILMGNFQNHPRGKGLVEEETDRQTADLLRLHDLDILTESSQPFNSHIKASDYKFWGKQSGGMLSHISVLS